MRILILGAGVVGSVYGGLLTSAGHDVVLLARDPRLAELRGTGLVLEEAPSGLQTALPVPVVEAVGPADRFELVLVTVRRDQLADTVAPMGGLTGDPDVVIFGNALGMVEELTAALGTRVLFGFPGIGGVRSGSTVRYTLIRAQRTVLGEADGAASPRLRELLALFRSAGFPTTTTRDPSAWFAAHAALVVPVAYALYRVETDAARLAADPILLRTMVRATRQAFRALRAGGNTQVPRNLQALYLWSPEAVAVRYWRGVLAGPNGELWFAGHSRSAPDELASLASGLLTAVRATGLRAPDLDAMLDPR